MGAHTKQHKTTQTRTNTQNNTTTTTTTQTNQKKVENFGALRYERSREAAAAGRALTQRHAATNAEIALAAGDRPYVALGAPADAFNAAEPASVEYL